MKLQNKFEISYFNRELLPRWEPFRKMPNSCSCVPCLFSKTDNIQVKQWHYYNNILKENISSSNRWNISIKPFFFKNTMYGRNRIFLYFISVIFFKYILVKKFVFFVSVNYKSVNFLNLVLTLICLHIWYTIATY